MKNQKVRVVLVVMLVSLFCVGLRPQVAASQSADSIALGKKLFNEKGTCGNKYACIMCHKEDKAIKKSELAKLGDTLPDVINKYQVEKAKGQTIPPNSPEMKALIDYINNEHSV
jgi:cytochrome c